MNDEDVVAQFSRAVKMLRIAILLLCVSVIALLVSVVLR